MGNDTCYDRVGLAPELVSVNRVNSLARMNNSSNDDDIEVIDLDNPRDQIKPTTWHR